MALKSSWPIPVSSILTVAAVVVSLIARDAIVLIGGFATAFGFVMYLMLLGVHWERGVFRVSVQPWQQRLFICWIFAPLGLADFLVDFGYRYDVGVVL